MLTVAALYVDRLGPYPSLPGVDAWFIDGRRTEQTRLPFDERFHFHRDARSYDGPYPVVAHPPCGPWGKLRHLSERPEAGLAFRAVEQVRAFGGVLEHPAGSLFWPAAKLPEPGTSYRTDRFNGYALRVAQSAWGHVARKWTWLYLVGVPPSAIPPPPWPDRTPTHWVSGSRGEGSTRAGSAVPPGIKVCSAEQRRRTPPAFAAWLVTLARASKTEREPMTMPAAVEPYRLAPITFLTAAIRAELTDLRTLCEGIPIRPLVTERLERVGLLLNQIERHAEP